MSAYAELTACNKAIADIDRQLDGKMTPVERTRLMAQRRDCVREAAGLRAYIRMDEEPGRDEEEEAA